MNELFFILVAIALLFIGAWVAKMISIMKLKNLSDMQLINQCRALKRQLNELSDAHEDELAVRDSLMKTENEIRRRGLQTR